MSYITSNKYTRANYGKEFRNFLLKQARLIEYIDFNGVAVFESATVDTSILSFSKQVATKNDSFLYCSVEKDYTGDALAVYCAKKGFAYQQSDLVPEGFSFVNSQELAVKKQIESIGTPLKDWDINIYRGVLTGFNEAFIIDTAKRDELVAQDPKSAELIKPTLRGRDVKRYGYEWAGLYIISTFPSLTLDIDLYPAIKSYLAGFGKRLDQSGNVGSRKKTGNEWFETQDQIGYWKEFEKEKIIWMELSDAQTFALDNSRIIPNKTLFSMAGESLVFLLSILNSKVVLYYFNMLKSSSGVGTTLWQKNNVERLPIPKISLEKQAPFIALVDYILYARSQGLDQEAKYFEAVIDIMVFGLYFEASMKKK